MFPISDVIPSRTRPIVTISLIALNTLVYVYQVRVDESTMRSLVFDHGVIPASVSAVDILTSLFIHAGPVHFFGNMIFLWIFGDNVEDRLGHGAYLVFYLVAGSLATLTQVAADPTSHAPLIGASGAIAGVMGAYFLLYPQSRVLTAVFLVFFMDIIEVPAVFFLGVWFLLQILQGALGGMDGTLPTVAFWAHAGGFATGAVVGLWIRTRGGREYWQKP